MKPKNKKNKILDPTWCKWAASQPLEKLQQMESSIYHILSTEYKEDLLKDRSDRPADCQILCAQHAYIYKLYNKFVNRNS